MFRQLDTLFSFLFTLDKCCILTLIFLVFAIGVYFELNGVVYMNNSAASLLEVGEGENALFCKTSREECCGTPPNRFGEFYYPNGTKVPIAKLQQGFYCNRGQQVIRLNRREGVTSPAGRYQCEIPDASGMTQNIYIVL